MSFFDHVFVSFCGSRLVNTIGGCPHAQCGLLDPSHLLTSRRLYADGLPHDALKRLEDRRRKAGGSSDIPRDMMLPCVEFAQLRTTKSLNRTAARRTPKFRAGVQKCPGMCVPQALQRPSGVRFHSPSVYQSRSISSLPQPGHQVLPPVAVVDVAGVGVADAVGAARSCGRGSTSPAACAACRACGSRGGTP